MIRFSAAAFAALAVAIGLAPPASAAPGGYDAATAPGSSATPGVPDPERAWRNYALNCQGCHRPDGSGDGDTAPALAGHIGVFTHVDGGRAYLGRVPGVATAPLPDDQVAELLNWVLARFDPDHVRPDFAPYTPEEVAKLRQAPFRTEVLEVRAALLARAPH